MILDKAKDSMVEEVHGARQPTGRMNLSPGPMRNAGSEMSSMPSCVEVATKRVLWRKQRYKGECMHS